MVTARARSQSRAGNGRADDPMDRGRSDRITALTVFLSLLALYEAVSPHKYAAYDSSAMVAVTHNLVNHFTLKTTGAFYDSLKQSTPYSDYGLGLSLALVPFYAISKVTGFQGFWESFLNPLMVAASGAVVYSIGRCLGWRRSLAAVCAIAFGSLTMALPYTTELFSEAGVGLCATLVVLAVLRWRQGWRWSPLVLGLALGAAIQFRTDSVLTVGAAVIALPLFVPIRDLLTRRALLAAGVPVLASLALLFYYNQLRYGSIFVFSYHGGTYSTPLSVGLRGLLISPGKGFFLFNLIAIPGVVGLMVMAWRNRPVAALFALMIIPRLIFFAKWSVWAGGVSWGPRFLMPISFLFTIAAFELVARTARPSIQGWSVRAGLGLVCLASVPIAFASARVPFYQWWNTLKSPQARVGVIADSKLIGQGRTSRDLLGSYYYVVQASEIAGDYRLLHAGRAEMDPVFWRDDFEWAGWLLIAAFAVGSTAAVAMAAAYDGRDYGSRRRSSRRRYLYQAPQPIEPSDPESVPAGSGAGARRGPAPDFYPRPARPE